MSKEPTVTLSAIVAMASNRVIGHHNQLPWHLPADLKHFKEITTGHAILMGRKTHESIGRPLPNRINIILTRDPHYQANGCHVVTQLDDALKTAANHAASEIFIIGGAQVYTQLLPQTHRIYLTKIHQAFDGDTYFPELKTHEWDEKERIDYKADEQNPCDYSFLILERRL